MEKKVWNSLKITPVNTSVVYALKNKSFLTRKLSGIALKYIIKNTFSKINLNPRYYENAFVYENVINLLKKGARILDIGSAESEVPLYFMAMGYDITAFDQREYPFSKSVQGDAHSLSSLFPAGNFQALTVISTIEHIGIGAYGDPKSNAGYLDLIAEWKKVIAPGGYLFLTLPVTSAEGRKEPGQWVENIENLKKMIPDTKGILLKEKLIRENPALSNGWEEIPASASVSFYTGVYMCIIQF